jgi:hypothetical protein
MLSQFPAEKEMLFPPLSMLTVLPLEGMTEVDSASMAALPVETTTEGASFVRLVVTPTFI